MTKQGASRERTLSNVKDFWEQQAKEWGASPMVTIRDHYFRLLGIEVISDLIKGSGRVLDIGCGNGFATLFYSQVVEEIIGADYAAGLIAWANRFLDNPQLLEEAIYSFLLAPSDEYPAPRDNVRFEVGDILGIPYPKASFDTIVTERVLINLPTSALQTHAIGEIARVLKPGGKWILIEVTEQGHKHIDILRRQFGLEPLEKYWHNLYLDEPSFEDNVWDVGFIICDIKRFEVYQFLSKIVHPLLVAPEEPQFLAGFNKAARIISSIYPDYDSVRGVGLEHFLREDFRIVLLEYDPGKITRYDQLMPQILETDPDFSLCSHQVLYSLQKRSTS